MKRYRIILWFLIFSLATYNSIWAGTCALCREALRSGGNANLINGYYWSIVLIVSVPLAVLAVAFRYAKKSYLAGRAG